MFVFFPRLSKSLFELSLECVFRKSHPFSCKILLLSCFSVKKSNSVPLLIIDTGLKGNLHNLIWPF